MTNRPSSSDTDTVPERVFALVAALHDDRHILFKGTESGLFHSSDGGVTWLDSLAAIGLSIPVFTLACPPRLETTSVILAGTSGGILRSVDGGSTWHPVSLANPAPVVAAVALAPDVSDSGIALAATIEDGVFRTADGGRTWSPWNFGLLDQRCTVLTYVGLNSSSVFVGTETGLFRSDNEGRSWAEVALPTGPAEIIAVADDQSTVFAVACDQLFRSVDLGRSWTLCGGADGGQDVVHLVARGQTADKRWIARLTGNSVELSVDQGEVWKSLPIPGAVQHLAPGAGDELIVIDQDGQLLSLRL